MVLTQTERLHRSIISDRAAFSIEGWYLDFIYIYKAVRSQILEFTMSSLTDPDLTVTCHKCHEIFPSYAETLPPSVVNLFHYHLPSQFSSEEIVSLAQKDLSRYDSEIERVEETLRRLRLERQTLHDYMLPHQAISAPIRTLPNEILREIFLHACDSNDLTSQSLPLALTIMRVCSQWCSLANSTRHLWSNFVIKLPSDKLSVVDILALYLERSKDASLRFHLEIVDDGFSTPPIDILTDLLAHSHRWLDASFNIPSVLYPKLLPAKGKLPILTTLGINRGNHDTAMFEDLPSLRTVVCHGFPNANLIIPWNQITSLIFSRCWIGMASQTLSLCPNVTHVEFSSCFRFQKDEDPDRFEINVSSMLINSSENGDVWKATGLTLLRGLLHGLTCPQLKTLDIRLPGLRAWSQPHVVAFLTRSECKLTTLCLKNVVLTDKNLEEILSLCPTLTHLTVAEPFNPEKQCHVPILTPAVINALTLAHSVRASSSSGSGSVHSDDGDDSEQPGSLLPRLEHLELSGGVPFSIQQLLWLLESRTSVMRAEDSDEALLQSVYVRAYHLDESEDVIARLRELRKGGLSISIEVGQDDVRGVV